MLRRIGPDLRPLRIPPYRRLFLGQITTVIGAMLTTVAVQQQIFDITQNSAWVGIASLVALVPLVAFGLLGGAIADTYDRRKLLMITSVGIAATSIGLWVAALADAGSVWVVLILLAVQQGFFAVNQPTRSAIIPRIVPAELVPSANALGMTVFSLGVIVGPLLVGLLIPLVGLPWLYFLDALTLVAILYAVIKLPPIPPLGAHRGRARVLDGIAYLRVKPLLLITFVVDIIAMVFGMPRALFPELADTAFEGPSEGGLAFALLFAAIPAGAVVGGVLSGWVSRVERHGLAVIVSIGVWGLAVTGFGVAALFAPLAPGPMLPLAVVLLAIGGAADMASSSFRNAMLLDAASDALRGRLQGIFIVVVAGGPRIADVAHGAAAATTGAAVAAAGGGVLVVVGTVVAALAVPAFVRYRVTREPGPASATR